LLSPEVQRESGSREKTRIDLRFKQSQLDKKTTIDEFNFSHHESRKREKTRILRLMDLEFLTDPKDIILIGNPGTGKTFLARCIAYAATQAKLTVCYSAPPIRHLIAASELKRWPWE